MQDAGGVGGLERVDDRIENLGHAPERYALATLFERIQVLVQILPGQHFHHQTQLAAVATAHVEQLDRGGAFEHGHGLLLAHQPFEHVRLARGLGAQDLDRDAARHPTIQSGVHRALTAAPDHALERIALANDLANSIGRLAHDAKPTTAAPR